MSLPMTTFSANFDIDDIPTSSHKRTDYSKAWHVYQYTNAIVKLDMFYKIFNVIQHKYISIIHVQRRVSEQGH